jgi:hypothetical protein
MKRPTFTRHARRLERAVAVIASVGAVCAIWMSLGFPTFPIALGDTPSVSDAPFVTHLDIPTPSQIHANAPLARHRLPKRLARISQHAAAHSTRPTPATVTPVPEHTAASPTAAEPVDTEQTQAPADAGPVVATSTTSPRTPPPSLDIQPPTITLPPAPQLPLPLPQVTELPALQVLPEAPTLLPLPPLP